MAAKSMTRGTPAPDYRVRRATNPLVDTLHVNGGQAGARPALPTPAPIETSVGPFCRPEGGLALRERLVRLQVRPRRYQPGYNHFGLWRPAFCLARLLQS